MDLVGTRAELRNGAKNVNALSEQLPHEIETLKVMATIVTVAVVAVAFSVMVTCIIVSTKATSGHSNGY